MPLEIDFVTNRVFPIAPLPDAPFAFRFATWRAGFGRLNATGENRLEQSPPCCKVCVPWRQGPDGMQVVRQHDYGLDSEDVARPNITKGTSKQIDSLLKQARAAVGNIDRKEETPAWNKIAPVCSHPQMLERPGERKQADRWVSPGSTHPTN